MTKEEIKHRVFSEGLILQVKNTIEHNTFLNKCFPKRNFHCCSDKYYWATSKMNSGYDSGFSINKDIANRPVESLEDLLNSNSKISINLNLI